MPTARVSRLLALLSTAVLGLAACGTQQNASGGKIGGTVHVLGEWSGAEKASFDAVMKPFTDQTGVKVSFEATRDLNAIVQTRVAAGNPPDVTAAPGIGTLIKMAKAGQVLPLEDKLDMSQLNANYGSDWINLGKVNGKLVTLYAWAALKGLVWYDPKAFQAKGYTVPKTWQDLITLQNKIKADGTTPWCLGLESGAASGWPGSDFHKEIVLSQSGINVYNDWWAGKHKWSSPEIKKAWQTWGTIVGDPKMVFGGKSTILTTNFGDSGTPMFSNPPKCYLHHQASFITDFFTKAVPGLKPGEDFAFFMTPDIDSKYAGAVTGSGDLFGMFKDTPQARALMKYLTTAEAQAIWVGRGGALSPNKKVTTYPDAISKQSAEAMTAAKIFRFDASDLMPDAMNAAFWKGILDYVNDPSKLDSILANLDKVQADSYK